MRLYSGTTAGLLEDATNNRIATKLSDAFFHEFRFAAPSSEVNSWRNSIRAVSQVFERGDLLNNGVILEFQLPLTSRRLDCLVTGRNNWARENAVIVELKQWDKCQDASGRNELATWVGGGLRDVLHPSAQVGQYKTYLEDAHTSFDVDSGIQLNACSYLHNYSYEPTDVLFAGKFRDLLQSFPIFTGDDVGALINFLRLHVANGDDGTIVKTIEQSKYKASRKLLEHVSAVIKGNSQYVLLDEQLVVYDRVLHAASNGVDAKKKTVVIVRGGPGTGKSVIAMNLLSDLSAKGLNTHYVTGSRAFTTTIREIVGSRASQQIKYFNGYAGAAYDDVDVMVCDEAHRIRESSNSRFTPRAKRSSDPQIEELINASKTVVFFIDDDQAVRPGEIGSSDYIRTFAKQAGCTIFDYELEAQFRCAGSDAFVNWINNTLQIKRTANVLWSVGDQEFDFKIFPSPNQVEAAIRQKADHGYTARMTAGFCWKWSAPRPDGTLVNDIVIGEYVRPWNAKSEAGHLAPGIPSEKLWAYQSGGINQIGCIYTAQGFEFDYVGVIFGTDLVFDASTAEWKGNPVESADSVVRRSGAEFLRNVKNTYRVLLSRGIKGCYVCFLHQPTEIFFRSRMENISVSAMSN
jgi:DUF2075 family protein